MTMSYTKRNDITAGEGETVVELDTGALVAVSCTAERSATGVAFLAKARAINEDGTPVLDATGSAVATQLAWSVAADRLDGNEARDCMRAVLGETVERSPAWSERMLASASIRVALTAAPLVGVVDAEAVL